MTAVCIMNCAPSLSRRREAQDMLEHTQEVPNTVEVLNEATTRGRIQVCVYLSVLSWVFSVAICAF